jgi:hypothetical protein
MLKKGNSDLEFLLLCSRLALGQLDAVISSPTGIKTHRMDMSDTPFRETFPIR